MIQHPLEIPRAIHEAFHLARSGRPGPVLVDIPQDLSRADIEYEPVDDVSLPGYQPTTEGNQKQIRLAAKALANSRRPVIYAGGGVVNANAADGADRAVHVRRLPRHLHGDGAGRLPRPARPVAGDAGHARHPRRQLRDGRGRPDLRGGRPLRRPHHRQAVGVRAAGQVHPHRRRPGRDLQERARAHPDRGRRQEHPAAPDRRVPRAGHRPLAAGGLVEPHPAAGSASTRWATRTRRTPRSSPSSCARRCTRPPAARRSSPPTSASTRCGRRSTIHFNRPRRWINSGRAGHDGLRPAGGHGRQGRLPRPARVLPGRRRLGADEHAGAGHLRRARHPDQGLHHEQRLPGHGAPVAGAVLGPALQRRGHGPLPRLRQAGRRLRRHRHALRGQDHAGRRHARGASRPTGRCWSTCASPARRTPTR